MDGSLIALALLFGASPAEPKLESFVGTWKVSINQETRDLAAKSGMTLPKAKLKLKDDKTFEYVFESTGKNSQSFGNYELKDNTLVLLPNEANEAWPSTGLSAQLEGGKLAFDGLRFSKLGPVDVAGTWVVRTTGGQDASIKMSFDKKGTFEFRASNAESKGRYQVDEGKITLFWTEVDGFPVKEGSMKKVLPLDEEGQFFKIDKFEYVRKA